MAAMNLAAIRGRATHAVGMLLLVAVSAWGAKARAQPPPHGQLLLEWNAPAECPSVEDLRAAVARLLGGKVELPPGRMVEVRATVTPGSTWHVELEAGADAQKNRRALDSASCAELADATALIVALMIDANAVAASPPRPASPPPAAPAAVAVPTERKAVPMSVPMSLRLGLLGSAGLGILPGLDAGVGGSLALVRGFWRFDLRASYGLRRDQTATAASPPGAYGTFNYTGAVAGVCRNFARLREDLGVCADFELGVLSAQGYKVTEGLAARTPWLGLGPAGYLAIRAGRRLSFPVRAALIVPITRPEFVINHVEGNVFRVAPLSGKVSVGAELHF
jgi:hypothetical protein